MENQIRGCPYWEAKRDETRPDNAQVTMTDRKIGDAPSSLRAYATGASAAAPETNVVYFIIPSRTIATPTYRTVQTISEAMIPNGMSFCGFLASSDAVETESNPI